MDRLDEVYRNLGASLVETLLGADASPIEKKFLAGFLTAPFLDTTEDGGRCGRLRDLGIHEGRWLDRSGIKTPDVYLAGASCLGAVRAGGMSWALMHQLPLGRYVADFAIVGADGKVVVECDGHDFHERSKEQAKKDRRRDRWMQSEGWLVLRFTGSELWNDAHACGEEVAKNLERLTEEGIRRYMAIAHAEADALQAAGLLAPPSRSDL
jgi:very-short-patch-repair endonuclease